MGPTPESLTNLGLAQAAMGRLDRAIRETRHALALYPSQRERVVFNLATYLISNGDGEEAIRVVDRLNRSVPTAETAFVQARLHLGLREPEQSLRVLRRARTRLWAQLDSQTQAELDANLAFVRGGLEGLDHREIARELHLTLERTDYASLRIASLLPSVLTKLSDLDWLREIVGRVREQHPADPLYELETHLAILERRFETATSTAIEWSQHAFLDPEPATLAVYLMCDIKQDYEGAVGLGISALRRMPAAAILAHNVGYALALSGRPADARRCLIGDQSQVPAIATRALIQLREGDVDSAVAGYREAFEAAAQTSDGNLPLLVDMHARFALARFAPGRHVAWEIDELEPDEQWMDDRSVAVAIEMLNRANVDLPPALIALQQGFGA
jgi:tetratricopeptide (TPR) repeat protein